MTAVTLWDLAAEHRALAERLLDLDLDDQTISDTLEAESGALDTKAQNVVALSRSLDALAEAIGAETERMVARRKAVEARALRLRDYVRDAMLLAGVERITGPRFAVSLQVAPQRVVIDSVEQIPQGYMRIPAAPPPSPDKQSIAAALKSGVDVPGARLERGAPVLRVR